MKNKNKQTKPTTKPKPQQQPKKKIENHACSCGPPAQGGGPEPIFSVEAEAKKSINISA